MANASSDTSSVHQQQPASQAVATNSVNSEKDSPATAGQNVAEPKDAENKVAEANKQKRQVRYSFQKKPFIIGVAGGTASGKSTVCSKIMEKLGPIDPTSVYLSHEKRVICISQDSFYRKLDDKEKEKVASGNFNFDHPNSFDEKLLESTLSEMKSGKMVKIPVYNYMENQIGDSEQVIYPADVVLVEGLLLFYFPEVRQLFDMKVFVDTDPDTRLARRVMRDVTERHRDLEVVLSQYTNFVKPSFEEFCLPTKKYADIIVPRGPDNEVAIHLIVQTIRDLITNSETSPAGNAGFAHHYNTPTGHHQHLNSNGDSFSSTPATPVNQPSVNLEAAFAPENSDSEQEELEPQARSRHYSDSRKDISYNRIFEYDE